MTPAEMRNLLPIRSQTHGKRSSLCVALLAALLTVSGDTAAQTEPAATERLNERNPATGRLTRFEGRIEASQQAAVSTRLDGVVEAIHFKGGEVVEQGDLLISLDPTDKQLALEAAEAELKRAKARLTLAEQDKERVAERVTRGTASLQRQEQAAAELMLARAEHAAARVSIKRAETNLERTSIQAPSVILGRVIRPAIGARIEVRSRLVSARLIETFAAACSALASINSAAACS